MRAAALALIALLSACSGVSPQGNLQAIEDAAKCAAVLELCHERARAAGDNTGLILDALVYCRDDVNANGCAGILHQISYD